ncbi:hypothetical protein JHK82_037355 [Glycine max]|nr:hypothetical protein JHK85_038105 [Glycine max]KAG5114086.1 hypothetical protein JHK82_037355 [Glycine max]
MPKLLKRKKGEDIISKLPESLITCILSSLPLKDAVRTSVLSKKWLLRWTSITKLELDDIVFHYPKKKKTSGKTKVTELSSLSKAVNPWENKDPKIESLVFVLLKQFRQMKYLKLEGGSELGLVSGEVLLGLLLKSPVLKTLAFKGISKFDKELLNSAAVLECLTSTLQVVKFHKLHGFEHKLCFAKFVMENGLISGEDELLPCQLFMGKSKVYWVLVYVEAKGVLPTATLTEQQQISNLAIVTNMDESSDSNVVGSSTCKEKLSKKVKAKEGAESIMNKLPEQLISHILSLLQLKMLFVQVFCPRNGHITGHPSPSWT